MDSRNRPGSISFRDSKERLESRLLLSGNPSVPAEIKAILSAAGGVAPARPNTPVLPLESPYATATFIDPSVNIIAGKFQRVGQKDYIAPNATLNATNGLIVIGSNSTIQDDAQVLANPNNSSKLTSIDIGDNVVVGDGAILEGPASIGAKGGAAASIGANALIDGAIIAPGAFVGALARVGPGVTVPSGYRVLPGANVTDDAEADTPSLGFVVKITATDNAPADATQEISRSAALAIGYSTLYQGNSAAGGAASGGPAPSAISATGSTIDFGGLNAVLGVSSEPGSTRGVPFEPSTGTTPTFLAGGFQKPIALNLAYRFPARVIGAVSFTHQTSSQFQASLGGGPKTGRHSGPTHGETIPADEGQPIAIESIRSLGTHVSIRSPLGGIQGTTTTTVVTSTTVVATGLTTRTSNTSTIASVGAPTATAGTTTAITAGVNAAGQATTGTVTTTIATKSASLGAIAIGRSFAAGDDATILGSPTSATTFGDGVTIGADSVVIGSTIGGAAIVGNKAYIANSTIPAGAVVPDGAIIVANKIVGTVEW